MVSTFKCRHCLCEKSANPRVKDKQSYCGDLSCQRARRAAWKRSKLNQDNDYRLNHNESNKSWRQSRPDYWREYRQKNPEKAKRNCLLQRLRRIRAQQSDTPPARSGSDVAKVDALFIEKFQGDRMFWLQPAVAKVDALLVEISPLSGGCDKLQRSTR